MDDRDRREKLPVGIESFEEIRREGFYYVDKTAMIRDLLDRWSKVNLFTRPRRFGKSLNMSMLRAFFEIGGDRTLFDGLKIAEEKELCERYMGRFPVISISLKDACGADYTSARAMICSAVGNEAMRFQFLLESGKLTDKDKQLYHQLTTVDETDQGIFLMSDPVLAGSLKTLAGLLQKHYGRRTIILIDEYDVPLAKANERGYYGQMVTLIRSIFDQALKTNDHLYLAVLTGCLRIAKESIFTGLNNTKIFSVTNVQFDEYFGFTDGEVREMLRFYGLEDRYGAVKDWYDGYRFGDVDVYCPWDVINDLDAARDDPDAEPKDYWSDTSGNDVIRHFIEKVDKGLTKSEIEALLAGETVTKEIREDLTYDKLYDSIDHIWSVLFTTGYLTQRGRAEGKKLCLAIPNMEIREIFREQIIALFKEAAGRDGDALKEFCDALQTGDAKGVERCLNAYLEQTISIRDTFVKKALKENFYHGILLGILGFKNGWYVRSNEEAGDGYSDILIKIERAEVGIVIEVKYAGDGDLDRVCKGALAQIERGGYAARLEREGIRTILRYGIACHKKRCKVMLDR